MRRRPYRRYDTGRRRRFIGVDSRRAGVRERERDRVSLLTLQHVTGVKRRALAASGRVRESPWHPPPSERKVSSIAAVSPSRLPRRMHPQLEHRLKAC